MSLKRIRAGELIALIGAVCVIVSIVALRWYEVPGSSLTAWDTFGATVVLLMLAALVALLLVGVTVTERSTALPVAAAVWSTTFGTVGVIAAIVRLLERPDGATALCGGAWLAFAGTILIVMGSWQSMRDERQSLYPPAAPEPREPPAG